LSTNEEEGPSIVTDTATAPILRLRKIEMVFGGVHALRGVDFDVAQGERLAILGPNGAGKTTLFNVIAGDFAPTAGSIEIRGRDVTTQPARTRPGLGVARTYQVTRLFPGLSVEDNLFVAITGKEGGHYRGVKLSRDADTREKARAAARQVWLHDKIDTIVEDLSHGEQRQLEVGMAISVDPSLLMLDEPASGLSRGERERLVELLNSLDRSVTLVLIEHDMDVALNVAEYVIMMHDGLKVAEGTPDEIRANQMVHDIYLGRVGSHD
jgi:branched-chain amino acid transport system ATP-binding protein